jgi:hypothetical protein
MTTPMTIEDFSSAFTTRIVDYVSLESNADTMHVVFEVKCNANGRVGVFIVDVDTTTLDNGFTRNDVVDAAWNEAKTNVNDWAIVNAPKVQYVDYIVENVSSAISITDFNTNFSVRICRFELYPKESPTVWCVGFQVYMNDKPNVCMFVDGTAPIEGLCNNVFCTSVAGEVWNSVKERVSLWASNELAKSSLIGSQYTPTSV